MGEITDTKTNIKSTMFNLYSFINLQKYKFSHTVYAPTCQLVAFFSSIAIQYMCQQYRKDKIDIIKKDMKHMP